MPRKQYAIVGGRVGACQLVLLTAMLLSCHALPARGAEPLWTVTRCVGAPSHVLYDSESRSLLVTQISGEGDKKDGVGVVSRLDLTGKMLDCEWVFGLDAPKGIARSGETVWVSDIDLLRAIDAKSGDVVGSLPVPEAKFLTGVAVDSHGTVYLADLLGSRIYQYRDETFQVVLEGKRLESPAGLAFDGERLTIAGWGLTDDFTTKVPGRLIAVERGTPRALCKPVGNLYGLASDGAAGWIATDFATGRVLHASRLGECRELLRLEAGIGGVEYVPEKKLLIVAELTKNRVSAYDVSSELKSVGR